jgi:hypothetical protein
MFMQTMPGCSKKLNTTRLVGAAPARQSAFGKQSYTGAPAALSHSFVERFRNSFSKSPFCRNRRNYFLTNSESGFTKLKESRTISTAHTVSTQLAVIAQKHSTVSPSPDE